MTDIFLSRPSWIAPESTAGLDGFLRLLATLEINPKTIGISRQPVRPPLDEVIALMATCRGAIVLGYPQLSAVAGTIKGIAIGSEVLLATEWNHIEAALAYSKGLPLLMIHHVGICRGVFDRGAFAQFLHQVDLRSESWAVSAAVSGALNSWRDGVRKYNVPQEPPARRAASEMPVVEVGTVTRQPVQPSREELDVLKAAAMFAQMLNKRFTVNNIAATLKIDQLRAEYLLDRMARTQHLLDRIEDQLGAVFYSLNSAGLAYLVQKNLLP